MAEEQLTSKRRPSLGIIDDPEFIDGAARKREDSLVRTLRAISAVFPSDAFPFDSLDEYKEFRRSLEEIDLSLRAPLSPSINRQTGAKEEQLLGRAIHFFETDLRLSRKQRLARMALSQDWSALPSYIWEGVVMWKCSLFLRVRIVLLRMRLHWNGRIFDSSASGRAAAISTSASKRPENHSDLASRLEKQGIAIVKGVSESVIKTGSVALDEALGVGGFPRGRIIEIFGNASAGKTTLALAAAANVQRNGNAIAYIDTEHKLSLPWARLNGLVEDQALILQGTEGHGVVRSLLEVTRSGRFALVVVDSLSALAPDEELDLSHRDYRAELEQLLAQALPRIASAAAKTDTCILLLNQIRKNDAIFGREKISAGGDVVDHYCSIRLELHRTTARKEADRVLGFGVKGTVLKSCVAPPFRVAEWTISFERGLI